MPKIVEESIDTTTQSDMNTTQFINRYVSGENSAGYR